MNNTFKPQGLETLDFSGVIIHKFNDNKTAIIKMKHNLKGYILIRYVHDNDLQVGDNFDNVFFDLGIHQLENKRIGKRIITELLGKWDNENEVLGWRNV